MNRSDLQRLAEMRVGEARALLESGFYVGTYYLAGYAIECALKAVIAKQVRQYDFPDRRLASRSHTHDLERLLEVAELDEVLRGDAKALPELTTNWIMLKEWGADARYETSVDVETAEALINAIEDPKYGVLTWLKMYW